MEIVNLKLPNDVNAWSGIVLDTLTKQAPKLAANIVSVDMKELDRNKGNATGVIITSGGHVLVPLIIRNFRLFPFDVFFHGNRAKVIADRTVEAAIFSPDVMSGKLVNRHDLQIHQDIAGLLSPPQTNSSFANGHYGYSNKTAQAKKPGMSLLGALKTASYETKLKFATELTSNREVVAAMGRLLPFEQICAELGKAVVEEGFSKDAHVNTESDCVSVDKSGLVYIKKAENGWAINGTELDCTKSNSEMLDNVIPSASEKSELMLTGELLVDGGNQKLAHITIITTSGLTILKDRSMANAICVNGDVLEGAFLPSVTDFDGNLTYKGVFLGKDGSWIYQNDLVGNKITVHNQDRDIPVNDEVLRFQSKLAELSEPPKPGDFGMFIRGDSALEPFTVISVYHRPGIVVMSVSTAFGYRQIVEWRKDGAYISDKPLQVATGALVSKYFPTDKVYIVGAGYRYINLGRRMDGARTPDEVVRANIYNLPQDEKVIVSVKRATDGGYIVKRSDSNIVKQAGTALECQWQLMCDGLSKKQAGILTDMSPVSFVYHNDDSDNAVNKTAAIDLVKRHPGAVLPEAFNSAPGKLLTNNTEQSGAAINGGLASNKAVLDDPDILNMALTLGMAKIDSNVRAYATANINDIHESIDKLGRLLLIVRTSEEFGVSEDILKSLIKALDTIAWELTDVANDKQLTTDSGKN